MKPLPLNADLLEVAPRVVWFEAPEKALADPVRFLAYVMTYGSPDDLAVVRRYVDDDGFKEALEQAPPGIMDVRSWAYWNVMAGKDDIPPMPSRRFPAG
ncbi:hypothetical protein [Pleomorphomonas oryzae]|uniref:hypothetical protein n=1 Tax=Pleomorphomonas oryzae TaxID=261934 RepID=UPI000429638F|nr:hypothetical protein [Pleomorphomonas oryzae]